MRLDLQNIKIVEKNFLDNYQMIIIGFADGFGVDTLSNANGEVKAIRKFIEDGKSVILHMIRLLLLIEIQIMYLLLRVHRRHGFGDIH